MTRAGSTESTSATEARCQTAGARWRIVQIAVGATALAIAIVGCSASSSSHERDSFWSHLRVHGDEVEGFGSLADMKDSADLVFVGTMASIGPSRVIQGDAAEDVTTYASVEFTIDQVLSGRAADAISVEFLIAAPTADAAADTVDLLRASLPSDPALLFLRAKQGEGEDGLFRLVSSEGLWMTTDRAVVDTPQAGEPGAHHYDEAKGVESLDELIDIVKGL